MRYSPALFSCLHFICTLVRGISFSSVCVAKYEVFVEAVDWDIK